MFPLILGQAQLLRGGLLPYGGSDTVGVNGSKRGADPTQALRRAERQGSFPATRTQRTLSRGAMKGSCKCKHGEVGCSRRAAGG